MWSEIDEKRVFLAVDEKSNLEVDEKRVILAVDEKSYFRS